MYRLKDLGLRAVSVRSLGYIAYVRGKVIPKFAAINPPYEPGLESGSNLCEQAMVTWPKSGQRRLDPNR